MPVKTRLAPTPSGYLHQGNAINFILNAALARIQPNGRVLLRIDDMDADRKRPEYLDDIFRTLDWLGIIWDEGPSGPDDFEKKWSQHHRIDEYEAFLAILKEKKLVFACAKSRKALLEYEGQYPDAFREQGLELTDPDIAWRARTPEAAPLPCFVVRRRDGKPAYQVVSICDDIHFGITDIIRGADLEPSSKAQQWLASVAGLDSFAQINIRHHPLLSGTHGSKLSKSAGAESVRLLGDKSEGKAKLFQIAANWMGISDKNIQNLPDLVDFLSTGTFNNELPNQVY